MPGWLGWLRKPRRQSKSRRQRKGSRVMSEVTAASGTVHWIGEGLSTGSGLAATCDAADRVRLWHRTEKRAARSLEALGLTGRAEPRAYTREALAAELAPGDVVV